VTEFRYLGIYIVYSRLNLDALLMNIKVVFKSVNAIFGKLGGVATEDVILHLVNAMPTCMPVILYGLACFDLITVVSLDFTFRRFMFRLFRTSDIHVVNYRKISSIMRTILSLKCLSEVGVRIIYV